MKKNLTIVAIVIVVLAAIPVIYVQANKVIYANRIMEALLEEKKVEKSEIRYVKGVWGVAMPPFYGVVVFEDEPDIEYIYFAHNKVHQFDYKWANQRGKEGISQAELKHYEPME